MSNDALVNVFLNINSAGGADFHPSENKIVYMSDETGTWQLFEYNLDNEKTTRITNVDDRCTNPVYLPSGDLLYCRDDGGDENFQIWIKGDTNYRLTKDIKAKHRFAFANQKAIYLSANISDKQRFDIYRYSIPLNEGDDPELLVEGVAQRLLSPQIVSEAHNKLVYYQSRKNITNDLYLFEMKTGNRENLTSNFSEKEEAQFIAQEFISKDIILISSNFEREFQSLALFNLNTKEIMWLEDDNWDTEEVNYIESRNQVIYSKNVHGTSKLYLSSLDIENKSFTSTKEISLPSEHGVLLSGDFRTYLRSFVLDDKKERLMINYSASNIPPNVYLSNIDDPNFKKITTIGDDFPYKDKFVQADLRKFNSFDELEVPYFIYIPKENEKAPVVFYIHGGPEAQITASFNKVIQLFVSQGYIVVTPNIRGSAGYGRTYVNLDNIEKRLDSTADIKSLADHIESSISIADGAKFAIFGGSYGGFAVLSSITEYPERFQVAIDIFGIANFVTFLQNTAEWRRHLREVEYGSLKDDMDTLIKISPIHKVDKIKSPILIIQGENDERVPLSESLQMYNQLQALGVPTEMVRFSDEGHGIVKRTNQITAYSKTLEFFSKHLR